MKRFGGKGSAMGFYVFIALLSGDRRLHAALDSIAGGRLSGYVGAKGDWTEMSNGVMISSGAGCIVPALA